MTEFLSTADSRATSAEIMSAILSVAGSYRAVEVWDAPSFDELLAIWEIVTGNGLRDSRDYFWGAAGSRWADDLNSDAE